MADITQQQTAHAGAYAGLINDDDNPPCIKSEEDKIMVC